MIWLCLSLHVCKYFILLCFYSVFQSFPISQLLVCVCFVVGAYFYITYLVNPDYEMDMIGSIMLFCSTVLLSTPLLQVVSIVCCKQSRLPSAILIIRLQSIIEHPPENFELSSSNHHGFCCITIYLLTASKTAFEYIFSH